ncbi:SAV_6107 family HEPN domain-containing protein [Cellulomonas sp. HZM]|uniref:SAV_6107 family HEPN domain-containing protein n=1 Tax=Cellulomonas sp. HZM TaxID=1454010 RepID=UPI000AE5FDC2|nr:SAV_6107 family HEPN domain-containing protein [Cellulomonas sp. HZM]
MAQSSVAGPVTDVATSARPSHGGLLSPQARTLMNRADAELVAAQYSPESWERFSHAHLAALRAGAAVVAARGTVPTRGASRTVWALLRKAAPELDRWAAFFEAGAAVRSAVDAGRFDVLSEERAEDTLCAAEDFVDAARALLGEEHPLDLRVARAS